MKEEAALTLEDIFSELESDLTGLMESGIQQKRLPDDIDAWQLAERWKVDISSARRRARAIIKSGGSKWQWIKVHDARSPRGIMILRKAENGKKAESSSGGNHKRK